MFEKEAMNLWIVLTKSSLPEKDIQSALTQAYEKGREDAAKVAERTLILNYNGVDPSATEVRNHIATAIRRGFMKIQVLNRKQWYYRLVSENGRVVLTSETYHNRGNAIRAAKEFRAKCGPVFCAMVPLEVKK